jgi:Family of unknown function (DUF6085)
MREISIGDYMKGFCPLGCADGLVVGPDRFSLMCPSPTCPRPGAVMEIITDLETEHVAVLTDGGYTIRHPLRERLDDALLTCDLGEWMDQQNFPPAPSGRYRVIRIEGRWSWFALAEQKEQDHAN